MIDGNQDQDISQQAKAKKAKIEKESARQELRITSGASM